MGNRKEKKRVNISFLTLRKGKRCSESSETLSKWERERARKLYDIVFQVHTNPNGGARARTAKRV